MGVLLLAVEAAVVAARPRLPQVRRLICLLPLRPPRCAAAVALAAVAVRHRSDRQRLAAPVPQVGAEEVLDLLLRLPERLRQHRQGHRQPARLDLPVLFSLTRRCVKAERQLPLPATVESTRLDVAIPPHTACQSTRNESVVALLTSTTLATRGRIGCCVRRATRTTSRWKSSTLRYQREFSKVNVLCDFSEGQRSLSRHN